MKRQTDREPRALADDAAGPSASTGTPEPPSATPARRAALPPRGFPLRWRQPGSDLPRLPMVSWFEPGELIVTGFRAMMSAIVGEQSDRRIVQALATRTADVHDYSTRTEGTDDPPVPRDGLWIDFVADTGDGFNPTYASAYLIAQPELALPSPDGRTYRLPRADLLILGGDMVYPGPGRDAYQQRLVAPFEAASAGIPAGAEAADPPHVFAVPGNHDWYDGLSAFLRLFCSDVGGRGFAAWRTRQSRSYFALRLPGRWWLVGADSQLHGDLDVPQIEFFETIAERDMRRGDRVIVCLSTPVWIHAHTHRKTGEILDETDLLYLRERVFGPRGIELKVHLSGDLHHYRRHEELDPDDPAAPIQKITAGGGGAFLHPTHDEDVSVIEERVADLGGGPAAGPGHMHRFALRASYPNPLRSWWLSFGNLAFGWHNPAFGIVPAVMYLMTAWLVASAIGYQRPDGPLHALGLTVAAFATAPGLTLWLAALVAAFVGFNRAQSRTYRWLGGIAHAAVHWACIFHLGWSAVLLAQSLAPGTGFLQFVLAGAILFCGGWVVGSIVMGLYLLVSLNVFGRHGEEAFSAMRIQDYKNFLRMHVAADGTLTIHPIGIERVPRRWREQTPVPSGDPARLAPGEPLVPALIEPPIVLRSSPRVTPADLHAHRP
jgi:hypothetical protein